MAAAQGQQSKYRLAPLKGLDLLSPITAMKEGTARRLDDWVCRSDGLHLRQGFDQVGNVGEPVVSLLGYPGRLFAATDNAIYSGSSSVVSGLNGGDWQGDLLPNTGGLWLVAVNGTDEARKFAGWQWSVAAIENVDSRDLFGLVVHQRRVFAPEKDSLRLWYLGLDAVEGPAFQIPLFALARKGGAIAAVGSWEPSGGRSVDAKLCIATTKGELIVYAGSNPDKADDWSLAGVWNIPTPKGKRAFSRFGADMALLTEDGLLSVSKIMAEPDSVKGLQSAISSPVVMDDPSAVMDIGATKFALVQDGAYQWIRSDTGAWSRFSGFGTATCWLESDNQLWFGTGDGNVCRYGGETDGNGPVRAFAVDAFSGFGVRNKKVFRRIRPTYTLAHPYVPRMEMLTDYREPPSSFSAANLNTRYWDWDEITWPDTPLPWYRRELSSRLQPWRSIGGQGIAGAVMMSIQAMGPIIWTGYDLGFEMGAEN